MAHAGKGDEIGVFIPIGNNGWLISTTAPQYKPTFNLNRQIVAKAEAYGLDFALSMIKLRGFGGASEFWDYNLESFTLMAGLAAVTDRINLYASDGADRAHGRHHRFNRARALRYQYRHWLAARRIRSDGAMARRRALRAPLRPRLRIRADHARSVDDRPLGLRGRLFSNARLPDAPAAAGADQDHLPRPARPRHALHGRIWRLQFFSGRRIEHAGRA